MVGEGGAEADSVLVGLRGRRNGRLGVIRLVGGDAGGGGLVDCVMEESLEAVNVA